MAKVTVYSMNSCPFCEAAKNLLAMRGVKFSEIKLSEDDNQAWDALIERTGMKTVPQIFDGENLIGGFSELSKLDQKDGLRSLKAAS